MSISVPALGWYVEVDEPGGNTLRPDVVGDPQRQPRLNGLPALDIPVRKDDKWHDSAFEGATMRVWYDGRRQPIDELETVEDTEGSTTLKGRGGLELDDRVEKEYDFKAVYLAAENLINNETSYTANVDTPSTTTTSNEQLDSYDTETEFTNAFLEEDATNPIKASSSLDSGDGTGIACVQTGFWQEGETLTDSDGDLGFISPDNGDASQAETAVFKEAGDDGSFTFTTEHDIPEAEVGVAARVRYPDDFDNDGDFEGPGWKFVLDGVDVFTYADNNTLFTDAYSWDGRENWSNGDLAAGSHTLTIEVTTNSTVNGSQPSMYVDAVYFYDARYHDPDQISTAQNSTDADDNLPAPTLYPNGATVSNFPTRVLGDLTVIDAITGGRLEGTANFTDNDWKAELSNDYGASYKSDTSLPFETDFASAGPALRVRLTLAATAESRTSASPDLAFNNHEITELTVKADTEDVALVVERNFDTTVEDILNELAQISDSIWQYQRDGATESIEWTTPGARTTSRQPDIATYQTRKTVEDVILEAVIYGSTQSVRSESFASNHGVAVALNNDRIRENSEEVFDSASGEVFSRGSDYEMAYQDGEITTQSAGRMDDSTSYSIRYDHKTFNTFTDPSAGADPPSISRDIPGATTDRACGVIARRLVRELKDPLYEATVTVPLSSVEWDLVDAVDVEEFPFSQSLEIQDITQTPQELTMNLGSRKTIQEAVASIRRRVASTSRHG